MTVIEVEKFQSRRFQLPQNFFRDHVDASTAISTGRGYDGDIPASLVATATGAW
jgi:hypothetical protein